MIDLENLKRVAGEATPGPWKEDTVRRVCAINGVPALGEHNAAFIAAFNPEVAKQLIEALECAVVALDQIQQIMYHPDGRIMLDDEANSAQVKIARNATARISALIGKGEGNERT
jgi:hypothetical protein